MTTCPLPVDWLDLLAGRPSVASRVHLDICPSCRAVADSLQDAAVEPPDTSALIRLVSGWRQRVVNLDEAMTEDAQVGGLYWLATEAPTNRVLVLVLGLVVDDFEDAVDVAPVWTDLDNAVLGDLLLNAADSTTGIPLRVAFRRQTVVDLHRLDTQAGMLTQSGMALLQNALAGSLGAECTGTTLESDFDPRLNADAWMDETLSAAAIAFDDDLNISPEGTTLGPDHSVDGINRTTGGKVFVFELKYTRRDMSRSDYRLAAAPRSAGKSVTEATIHDDMNGIHIVLWIWLNTNDDLQLRADQVSGIDRPVRLIIRSRQLDSPVEKDLVLRSEEVVTLASDVSISERDIESMEMQLV